MNTLNRIQLGLSFPHTLLIKPVILLTQYCAGGKIETNEMGRACSAYGGV